MYISIHDKIYNTNKRQITFVLTQGEAASWKEQFVGQAMHNCKKAGVPLDFSTFVVFETNFFEAFKPFDQTGDAWAEMKEMRFNGPTGNMDEHIAHFISLLMKTGMTNSTAVINCFRETLPRGLQQKIIMLPNAPENLAEWYKWATKIHHRWQVWNTITRSAGKSPAQRNKNGPQKFNFRPRPDLNAMDVNAMTVNEKMELMRRGACFKCKKVGHLS